MKAAIYLRVSKKDGTQDERNQEPDVRRLCAARGWEPVLFVERESGVKARPEWRRVLEAARLGHVQAVVFWSLDRVGRTRTQVAHDLGELFRWRVHVASVKDSWLDQTAAGPLRDFLVQVMAWVAEGERQRLIDRTNAGLDRARARGVRLGRPCRMSDAYRVRAIELLKGDPRPTYGQVSRQCAAEGLGSFAPQSVRSAAERGGWLEDEHEAA